MKTIPANLLASVLFALLLSPSLFATDYRYMRITMPDGSPTFVRGIDARGDIIGTYTDAGGVGHNFLLHNGAFTNIDYPGNGDIAAHGINARGDIVGGLADADGGHGFLLRDGQFTTIDYPGADGTTALAINNAGGFDIIDPPGAHDTFLFGMNDDGIVMGIVTDRQGNVHGFEAIPKN